MSEYNLQSIDVLVVEKHFHMRRLIRDILAEFGVGTIRVADTVENAFEMFQERASDLVLTDWSPGLDGIKFLELVRRNETSGDMFVPIIMVTANTELNHVCIARDAGINEYLAKPFSARLIYHRIKSIIENPRLFVRTGQYFGPDRRRRRLEFGGLERRQHANLQASDRRGSEGDHAGSERRQGQPGYRVAEPREGARH
ncbi:MAG: response regulator [Rhodospirillales bacterium]|nr:response regulator [Rhodospirillales bacterium]